MTRHILAPIFFFLGICNVSAANAENNSMQSAQINTDAEIQTKRFTYCEKTDYATVEVDITLPQLREDSCYSNIRFVLLNALDAEFGISDEGRRETPRFEGNWNNIDAFLHYYCKPLVDTLSYESKQQNDEMDESRKEAGIKDADDEWKVYYTRETNIHKIFESSTFVVFDMNVSTYYGGPHPNNYSKTFTFSKLTGYYIEDILKPNAVKEIQPLLKKGLISYFNEDNGEVNEQNLYDNLLLDTEEIPLPVNNIYPDKDGIVFIYCPYEIAPHAAGMPAFTIPYEDMEPYYSDNMKEAIHPF